MNWTPWCLQQHTRKSCLCGKTNLERDLESYAREYLIMALIKTGVCPDLDDKTEEITLTVVKKILVFNFVFVWIWWINSFAIFYERSQKRNRQKHIEDTDSRNSLFKESIFSLQLGLEWNVLNLLIHILNGKH